MSLIYLDVSDQILKRGLAQMVKRTGHTVTEDGQAEEAEFVIRESGSEKIILSRATGEDTFVLERPISEEELKKALTPGKETVKNVLTLSARQSKVSYGKQSAVLTEKEFAVMQLLMQNRGKPVPDSEIKNRVFGMIDDESNISAVYVNYIRKKLSAIRAENVIVRVRGQGYMLK